MTPLGAYAASTLTLARAWHSGPLEAVAVVLLAALVVFWLVVTAGTLRAMSSGSAWVR